MSKNDFYNYEIRKLESLIPYANNSRTHSPQQINEVAASIKEFGFTSPVLIEPDGGIVAGHGRVMAAEKLGITEIPCIVLCGLTKAQKKAYVIADNQIALNSGWDFEMLQLEVESLREMDFDLEVLALPDVLFEEDQDDFEDGFDEDGDYSTDDPAVVFAIGAFRQEVSPEMYERIKDRLTDAAGHHDKDVNAEIIKRLLK